MYRGIFLAGPNSGSRRATNNTLPVDRAKRKPHVARGVLLRPRQLLLERHATIFNNTLPAWAMGNMRNPPAAGAFRTMLVFVKNVYGCIVSFAWIFFSFPHADEHVVKSSYEFGVVDFQQLHRNRTWPHRFPIRNAPSYPRHLVQGELSSWE